MQTIYRILFLLFLTTFTGCSQDTESPQTSCDQMVMIVHANVGIPATAEYDLLEARIVGNCLELVLQSSG